MINKSSSKRIILATALAIPLAGAVVALLPLLPANPIQFVSAESRTAEGGPVHNRIQLFSGPDQDVWMMQQSHLGPTPAHETWDRLAIVVDKTQTPKTARFVQLAPGPFNPNLAQAQPALFRVSCYQCHSNGPRVVRPDAHSPLSWAERARVLAWNLRIKMYGRVVPHVAHAQTDPKLKVPFRLPGKLENTRLLTPTCVQCHDESGWVQRGFLTRQQAITISFMGDQGHMPPSGHRLPPAERRQIQSFIQGF